MLDFDELIDILSELVNRCSKERELNEAHLREFKYDKGLGLANTRIAENPIVTSYLQLSHRLIRVLAYGVKGLTDAIDKLPEGQEFTAVKEELASMKNVVKDVVVPKQAIEEEKQRDRRGDDVYA